MTTATRVLRRERTVGGATAAPLTRSPIHAFILVAGALLAILGWAVATVFDRTVTALNVDLIATLFALPPWVRNIPALVATIAAPALLVAAHVWALATRRLRSLVLGYAAAVAALLLSLVGAMLLEAVFDPVRRAQYADVALASSRALPTDPLVAATIALHAVLYPSLPRRARRALLWLVPVWLTAGLAIGTGPPHLGFLLDAGVGMLAGGAVGVVARTPSVHPGRDRVAARLADSGLPVTALERASVDARGSVPWFAQGPAGPLFIKTLSREQRLADVLFRALRWLRLRRAGDPPPETSLRRAAEHEAFLSLHVRRLGVPTPKLVTVAGLGDTSVALVYERVAGRSFDRLAPEEVTDDRLHTVWRYVSRLHRNGVAHRDLRLANLFLADDGQVLLIDFSFGELTARQQLLDTDVGELLTATAAVVGVPRAVRAAREVLGADVLDGALAWLHPIVLSTETRRLVGTVGLLEPLRDEVRRVTGVQITATELPGRLSAQRVIAALLIVIGLVILPTLLFADGAWSPMGSIHWDRTVEALVFSMLWYIAAGSAYRAASAGRVPLRDATVSTLVGRLPTRTPTPWSGAARVFVHDGQLGGMPFAVLRESSARWIAVGMAVAPVLHGAFVTAALRNTSGYGEAIGLGVVAGFALAAIEIVLLVGTDWGRELRRVWLDPDAVGHPDTWKVTPVLVWWAAAWIINGLAYFLAARAAGFAVGAHAIIAIVIAAHALASLTPAPGGIGAIELLLCAGFLLVLEPVDAAALVVVGRIVTFWLHIPLALAARGPRFPDRKGRHVDR